MIIRRDQSAYLGKVAFIRRIRLLLCEQFEEARDVPRHELNPLIFRQLERAEACGLLSEHAAATYVTTAWLLGPDFTVKYPAAEERLKDAEVGEAQKVLWLQTFTVALMDALETTGSGGLQHGIA